MERPPADPAKLLEAWMDWERGDVMPGRAMSNMKTGGLRELLEQLAAGSAAASPPAGVSEIPEAVDTASWTPVV